MVQALGITGIGQREVSQECQGLDEEAWHFRARCLMGGYPFVWLDATHLKVREDGRTQSVPGRRRSSSPSESTRTGTWRYWG